MGYCDIIKQKENLLKEKKKLQLQITNEEAVTSIVLKDEIINSAGKAKDIEHNLTDTELTVIKNLFGSGVNSDAAVNAVKEMSKLYPNLDKNELAKGYDSFDNQVQAFMSFANIVSEQLKNNPFTASQMQAVVLKAPDPKFDLLKLDLLGTKVSAAEKEAGINPLFKMIDNFINGLKDVMKPARLEKRNARITADMEALEHVKDTLTPEEYTRRKRELENKDKMLDVAMAIRGLGNKFFINDETVFNPIYAIHETEENKYKSNGMFIPKKDTERTSEQSQGYNPWDVDGFEIDEGTIKSYSYEVVGGNDPKTRIKVALDENGKPKSKIYHNNNSDALSPLAVLFGVVKPKAGKDRYYTFVNIPQYLKDVIRLESISAVGDMYKLLSHPTDSSEFNDMWGLDRSSPNYSEDLEAVIEKYHQGKIPRSVISNGLGRKIYASLPIQFQQDIDEDLRLQAESELGLYALHFMNNANLVEADETTFTYGSKSQNLIRIATHKNDEKGLLDPKSITAAISALEFIGATEPRAGFSLEADHPKKTKIRNSKIDMHESVSKRVKTMSDKPLSFTEDAYVLKSLYDADPELAYAYAGVYDIDDSKPTYDRIKEQSKINYGRMQVDALVVKLDQVALGEEFYLEYDFTISERYMIDSIINPQESKITRFLVTSKDLASSIDFAGGSLNADQLHFYKVGLAEAFDLDPDKKMDDTVIADLESKIVNVGTDGTITFVKKQDGTETVFEKAYVALKKLAAMDHGKLIDISSNKAAKDGYIKDLMTAQQKGGGFHTIQALRSLALLESTMIKAKKDGTIQTGGTFRTTFTLESDAITSGMIITLVQMGTEAAMRLAEKGGVYTDEAIARWKKTAEDFNAFAKENGIPEFKSFNDGKAEFNLTHGWLKEFSAHVAKELKGKDIEGASDMISQSAFADVYETVARSAEAELKLIIADLNNDIANTKSQLTRFGSITRKTDKEKKEEYSLKRELKKLELELAVANIVGDIKRSTAKPPTMVYIYGAMLSSIRKKLTASVVVPKVYELLNKPILKDRTMDEYRALFVAITDSSANNAAAEAIYKSFGVSGKEEALKALGFTSVERATEMSLIIGTMLAANNGVSYKQKSNSGFDYIESPADERTVDKIVFSQNGINAISFASEATVGAAFEKGFEEFSEMDKFRESIKFMEIARFTMFKFQLKKAMKRAITMYGTKVAGGGYKLSTADFNRMIKEIEKDGFGHSVNDINGGHQPLYSKEQLAGELRAVLMTKANEQFSTTSIATDGKSYKLNTGASGVIIIHSIDGYVDSVSSEMFNLIRIYDGSVSSINKLGEQAEQYNEEFAKANAQWNALVAQMNQLAEEIAVLEDRDELWRSIHSMSKKEMADITNAIAKLMDYKDIQNLSIKHDMPLIIKGIKDRYKDSVSFANDGKTEVTVFHQYLSDKFKGVRGQLRATDAMTMEDTTVDTVFGYLSNVLEYVQEKDLEDKFPYVRENGMRYVGDAFTTAAIVEGGDPVIFSDKGFNYMSARPEHKGFSGTVLVVGTTIGGQIDNAKSDYVFTSKNIGKLEKAGIVVLKLPTMKKLKGRGSELTEKDVELVKREIDKLFELLPDGYNIGFFPSVYYRNYELQNYLEMKKRELMSRPDVIQAAYQNAPNENTATEEQTEYINHSGGARGSDIVWGSIGEEYGVKSNHYYAGDRSDDNAPYGNAEISAEDMNEGRYEAAKAAKRNFGYEYKTMKDVRLIRNWAQVKHADAVFAVGTIVSPGQKLFPDQKSDTRLASQQSVTGGTGYAVGMAINHGKPVYVFDQKRGYWTQWNYEENRFQRLAETPKLTKNFAGIGTRNINDLGKQAIRDAYEATFGDVSIESGSSDSVVIDSNQTGLEYALTNPTHISPKGFPWVKGDVATRKDLASGIDYNGKHYADVEHAYQANNAKSKGMPQDDNYDYALMVDLIEVKLNTFPKLVAAINKQGGLEYMNKVVHKPTGGKSRWETGNKNLFQKALTEAYNRVTNSGSVNQAKAEDIIDIELSPSEAEVVNDIMSEMKDNKDCQII